jgi:hypothetical protein
VPVQMRVRRTRELPEAPVRRLTLVRECLRPVAELSRRKAEGATAPAQGVERVLGRVERTPPIAGEYVQIDVLHRFELSLAGWRGGSVVARASSRKKPEAPGASVGEPLTPLWAGLGVTGCAELFAAISAAFSCGTASTMSIPSPHLRRGAASPFQVDRTSRSKLTHGRLIPARPRPV